jgi:sugar phosphate isomerase/epimerase
MLRIAIQLSSLGVPIKSALPRLAEMGVTAVELDARNDFRPQEITQTGVRQIKKWLEDFNLKVCAVSFRTRRGYDVEDDLDRRIEATKGVMRFAYSLGALVVVNQVGRIAPDESDQPGWQRLCESLIDLGQFSQRAGAWLAMDTGTESGPDMAKLIDALPAGHVMVNLNPGNLIINGFSPLEAVQTLGPHIAHVHAMDGVRDLARGRGLEVALGRGTADFPALLGTLEEFNYRGFLTVIPVSDGNRLNEAALAVEYLKNIQ